MEDWSYSPENWVIQDLDMYPQDRVPNPLTIKSEVNVGESCGYPAAQTCPTSGRSQACAVPIYPSNGVQNAQYANSAETYQNSGAWPSDLDNIVIDSNLPNECDSPLKLEDFNMEFVYVDPSTLDQSAAGSGSYPSSNYQNPACQSMKYNASVGMNPVNKLSSDPSAYSYEQLPAPTFNTSEMVKQEVLPPSCIPSNPQIQGRTRGNRGRPRNEWRITNKKKGCVGRPRTKTLRPDRSISDPIKKEIFDDQYSDADLYGDPSDEKKERRREQNRRAARKLREKKKVHVENMKKSYEGIVHDNRRLTAEVEELKQLVEQLRTARDSHVCRCSDVFTPSPASSTSQANGSYETRFEKPDMTSIPMSRLSMELTHMDR